ncbi:LPXTG cell wall anchor domain-containing protein [Alkalicoccobacillus gibsonii]|uniref:LPXTG cell wall anchor domain-containing protein n=1 Tax=Alkalicoccobacillus gibsonii TaxID=79881 RepID=UPI00193366F3|nr:LPXTG cell wall anchor domain-containing protein [Alkalicoccobacillus gibsonii]MBM0065906.1 LPXTG cell wall anchor domain-containing protein [Alkalicoccobacillus gibsonii]
MKKAAKLTVATLLALGPVVAPLSANAESVEGVEIEPVEQLDKGENEEIDEQAEDLEDDVDAKELIEEVDEEFQSEEEPLEQLEELEFEIIEDEIHQEETDEDTYIKDGEYEEELLPASEQEIDGDNFLEDKNVRVYVIEELKNNKTLSWDYPYDGIVTESMLHDLTSLHIGSTYSVDNTVDLSFLAHTENLTHLDLEGVKAKDWSPLKNSKNLTSFGLMGVEIDNLEFLRGKSINELYIESIVKDWSVLSEMTLTTFSAKYSNFKDLDLLHSNESLTSLDIRHTDVKDIQSLVRFKNLEVLAVGGVVKQSDLDMIASINSLRSLNASESNLTDVSMFANTKLTDIILHHNQISDIRALSHIETIKMNSQEITLDPVMMDDDATELTIEDPIKGTESMFMLDDDSLTVEGIKKGQSAAYVRFALYGPNGSIFVGVITVPLVWGDEELEEETEEEEAVTPVAPKVKQATFVKASSADKVAVEVEIDGDVSEFDKVIVTLKNKETGHTVTSEGTIRKEAVASGMSIAGLRVGFLAPFAAEVVNERYVIEFDRTQFNPGEYEIAAISFVTSSGESVGGSELPSGGETSTVIVEDIEVEIPVEEEEDTDSQEESEETPVDNGTEDGADDVVEEGPETDREDSDEASAENGTEEGPDDSIEEGSNEAGKDDEPDSETPVSNEDGQKPEENQSDRDIEDTNESGTDVSTNPTDGTKVESGQKTIESVEDNESTKDAINPTNEEKKPESTKSDLVLNTDLKDQKNTSEVKEQNKESLPQTGEAYPVWMTVLGITALLGALGLSVGRKKRKEA